MSNNFARSSFVSVSAMALIFCNFISCSNAGLLSPKASQETSDNYYCFHPAPENLQTEFNSNTSADLQVFGDSLARGFSSCDPSANEEITTGFALPLSLLINRPLDNRAIGGTESGNQLVQIQTYGHRHTAIKLLMTGYNDAYFATDIITYKSNLLQSIQIMVANANLVIIGTSPNYYPDKIWSYWRDVAPYVQAAKEVVNDLNYPNLILVDVNQQFDAGTTTFCPDHVHFNSEGSNKIAEIFKDVLKEKNGGQRRN